MLRFRLLMLFSGAAGLVYQVVWLRLAGEILGVTVHAVTAVLATFLCGLALGGLVLGRVADRVARPLRFYGWLEIGIAGAALVSGFVPAAVEPLHVAAASHLASDSGALLAVRALCAAAIVLPGTFLMGGTLPAITRAAVEEIGQAGRRLAGLYAANTAGAVAGCLAAGFFLIRAIGVEGALAAAAAVNLLVGLAALRRGAREAPRARPAAPVRARPVPPGGRGLLVVMGLAGFVTLALEVFWTRLLVLRIGTTSYAFVTMLCAFLTGIALGGFFASALVDRLGRPRLLFGWLQLGIVVSALGVLPLVGAGATRDWLQGWGGDWLALVAVRFGFAFVVMLVPTTLIGMSFPLAGKIWLADHAALGADLGRLYGANTAGNVAGALLGGFALLPALGLRRGIAAAVALNLVNAAWAFWPRQSSGGALALWRVGALALAGVACAAAVLLWQPRPLTAWDERPFDRTLYYAEGVVATVKVLEQADDPGRRSMTVDGIRIGETSGGVDSKQQVLAHFPFLLAGDRLRDVLTIGLGTGILAGEVARREALRTIDCLEISPEVIEAAALFREHNGAVLDDPRVRVINDDGVNFLRRSTARYDAIICDAKSRTAHAGNSLFFSRDYYVQCRDHLREEGLLIQWVPLDVPAAEFRTILRTLAAVFPRTLVWTAPPHHAFLVAGSRPFEIDLARAEALLAGAATARLRRYGWRDAHGFASLLVADGAALAGQLGDDDTVNTVRRPVLEFYSLRAHALPPTRHRADNLDLLLAASREPLRDAVFLGADAARLERDRFAVSRLIEALVALERGEARAGPAALEALAEALDAAPDHSALRWAAAGALQHALSLEPGSAVGQRRLGELFLERGLREEAARHLARAVEIDPADTAALRRLGLLYGEAGDLERALDLLGRAARRAPGDPGVRTDLGWTLWRLGRAPEAATELRRAVDLDPDLASALDALALVLLRHPDPGARDVPQAVRLAERAAELTGRRNAAALATLSEAHAARGDVERAAAALRAAIDAARDAGGEPPREWVERLERWEREPGAK